MLYGWTTTIAGKPEFLRIASEASVTIEILTPGRGDSDPESRTLVRRLNAFFPYLDGGTVPHLSTASNVAIVDSEATIRVSDPMLIVEPIDPEYEDDPEAISQLHNVKFVSKGNVSERLQIIFNTRSLGVADVVLDGASPLIRPVLEDWIMDSSFPKKISDIGRAVNCTTRVVRRRTECWRACQDQFPELVQPLPSGAAMYSQQTIVFQRERISFTVNWMIELKDDGSAKSDLSIDTQFPSARTKPYVSPAGEMELVREALDVLVEERGVTNGIQAMVKIIFR